MLAFFAILWGVGLGYAVGGTHRNLIHASVKFERAMIVMFVVQAVFRGRLPFLHASRFAFNVWLASCTLLMALLWLNRKMPGMYLAAAGTLLNVNVVLANSAMPVSSGFGHNLAEEALAHAVEQSGGFYQLANPSTTALFLGDVLPLRVAGSVLMLSVGDVVLLLAVVTFLISSMSLARSTSRQGATSVP